MVSFTTVLALASSAVVVTAQEPPKQVLPEGYPSTWVWHVSDWEAGCSRGGCSYDFNLTVPAVPGQTYSGKFYCRGQENGVINFDNTYTPCSWIDGTAISAAARFGRRVNDEFPKQIEISLNQPGYGYEPKRHGYNFTAYGDAVYNRAVAPDAEFDVYPTVWQQLPIPEVN